MLQQFTFVLKKFSILFEGKERHCFECLESAGSFCRLYCMQVRILPNAHSFSPLHPFGGLALRLKYPYSRVLRLAGANLRLPLAFGTKITASDGEIGKTMKGLGVTMVHCTVIEQFYSLFLFQHWPHLSLIRTHQDQE